MILRTWHGAVPVEHGDAFEQYLKETGVAEAEALSGNLGAFVKRVEQDDYAHFFLLTYWEGWKAIHAFAGATPHVAVTYPQDRQYGLISDPIVLHQEVASFSPWFGESRISV
jgi:heme-degrading monooxygenase HmoA